MLTPVDFLTVYTIIVLCVFILISLLLPNNTDKEYRCKYCHIKDPAGHGFERRNMCRHCGKVL